MSKRKLSVFLTILLIVLVLLSVGLVYRVFMQKLLYCNSDFISFEIKNVDEYNLCKNSVNNYLILSANDFNNIQYFMRKFDKQRHKEYSDYLNQSYTDVIIKNIKKGIGDVYIVYYYRNQDDLNEQRIVLNFRNNHYYVLFDSIYENYKEEK